MENQIVKKMEKDMETGAIYRGSEGITTDIMVLNSLYNCNKSNSKRPETDVGTFLGPPTVA